MKLGSPMRPAVQIIGLSVVFAAFVAATPAMAQRDSPEARQACTPEVFRLCNDAVPDVGRITACLRRNRVYLVPECRRFIAGEVAPRRRVYRHYRHG